MLFPWNSVKMNGVAVSSSPPKSMKDLLGIRDHANADGALEDHKHQEKTALVLLSLPKMRSDNILQGEFISNHIRYFS